MDAAQPRLSLSTSEPEAVPYFCWDVRLTNGELRRSLGEGSEDEKRYWMARILAEARYWDVWEYLSLRRDVLPRWEYLRPRLGRRRQFWEFLIGRWVDAGLIELS